MMGDFATPTAANGSSICINNNNINSGINAGNNSNNAGIPKHSAVVERLRQRIEGCRRHHVNCENRYQQAHAEQLEIERRETVSLYQRSLEHRAKKSANNKQQNKQDPESTTTAEQRNNTLIALQETVKRKLDSARSPLNGEQNGVCDGNFSPHPKRLRKEGPAGGLDPLAGLPNSAPPSASPLHQMDIKPPLGMPNNAGGVGGNNHVPGRPDDLGKNGGLPDMKLNGSLDLDDGFGLLKDLKQEPLDDGAGMESSDTSLSNQNKLFSDINLNDQEWQELIDELANTVPEDDMHDLFNEDFEEKKEAEFTRQAAQTPLPQEPASAPPPQSAPLPMSSPQVRPSSSGPPFIAAAAASGTPPQQPLQQSPAVAMATGSPANCVARSPQTPTQAPAQASRPGNGFLMNPGGGVGPVPAPGAAGGSGQGGGGGPGQGQVPPSTSELSPAEQLKQLASQQQQRAKLIQKHQQQQQQQQTQAANWSPAGAPSSPYGGGPFNPDKPNSPMMYPQAFNSQNPMVAAMAGNPQKAAMNNYLPPNHMTMISQQPGGMGQAAMSKQQAAMLSYSNTKPLSHFSAVEHGGQRMTPPMAGAGKSPMMPYMQAPAGQGAGQVPVPPQAQGQMGGGQGSHLTEEQKRMLLMKQKLSQSMSYGAMQPHGQEQGVVGISRQSGGVQQPPLPGPGGVAPGSNAAPGAAGYLGNQQQAAMMKQMLQMEQEKRVQLHLMEQQHLLREQRQQQQQQQLLAEQQQQQQHLPRQLPPQQRNPYPVQQVNQFQGTPQELARNQALQSIRNARLLQQQQQQQQQQTQGMLPMAQVQNPASMPASGAAQSDMGMAYSGPQGQQGMYPLNPGMSQMLQHPNQSGMSMPPHSAPPGQRQGGGAGPAVGMVGGYGQGVMMNPALSQQQMKGPPVGQPMAKAQAQRLQSMMAAGGGHQGAAQWAQQQQQQTLQAMGGRTSGDMGGFGGGGPGYGMPPGGQPPRVPKQHFAQGMGQTVVDPRAINPAMTGQMVPHMPGQPRTNQPRPMVMTGMGPGMPNMTPFSQGPGQPMGGSGGAYGQGGQPQGYQRTPSQDLAYSYGNQPASAGSFNLPDGVELDSTDGWMDEFFPSQ
ncbi:mastermind-like protein 3 isoform X3 [Anguilla rostrata]|uniref:mastermind-like protein 3 isoform X3 n=1 Tax=Anguilla rostrata TaxID=7938 RepID=UPI0030D15E5B